MEVNTKAKDEREKTDDKILKIKDERMRKEGPPEWSSPN
jgi:hypothetical protein